jgi:tetratricopeptide (TPR) repeat protein
MLGAATIYESMYKSGAGEGQQYLLSAAALLEQAITVDPSLKDLYTRLADLYITEMGTTTALQAAVAVLNKAVALDPNNPDIYLKLGTAQRSLGNTEAAVLSWQKYLQLEPNGQYADLIREQLDKLAAQNTTTTAGTSTTSSTTTSASTTTTTASTTTTTTAAPTSSTAR